MAFLLRLVNVQGLQNIGTFECPACCSCRSVAELESVMKDRAGFGTELRASIAIAVILAGCSARLVIPAPGVRLVGNGTKAVAESAGVQITVWPNRWEGNPPELQEIATPLLVRIKNESDQPLKISYGLFQIVGQDKFATRAVAPYKVDGAVLKPVVLPQNYYNPPGFQLAPHYRAPKETSLPRHPWDYDEYTPDYALWTFPLPTEDMLARGIPEGVLESGAQISGYLYFPRLPDNVRGFSFRAALVSAASRKPLRTIEIPFLVK